MTVRDRGSITETSSVKMFATKSKPLRVAKASPAGEEPGGPVSVATTVCVARIDETGAAAHASGAALLVLFPVPPDGSLLTTARACDLASVSRGRRGRQWAIHPDPRRLPWAEVRRNAGTIGGHPEQDICRRHSEAVAWLLDRGCPATRPAATFRLRAPRCCGAAKVNPVQAALLLTRWSPPRTGRTAIPPWLGLRLRNRCPQAEAAVKAIVVVVVEK